MTTSTSTNVLPMLLAEVEVVSVERLSPSFVRVELGGAELGDFGVDGERYDQRIKLVFPDPVTGGITSVADADESWLATWLDQPTEERGHMRTYTIRDVRGSGVDTTIVVDIVLHLAGDQVGPGSNWAADAAPGDRLVMLAPRRGFPFGGIEFAPAAGADLLMVADETAVPAVCTVLEQLPPTATGAVFMEVPTAADVLDVRGPDGVSVTWLARGDAPLGQRLHDEVVAHLGIPRRHRRGRAPTRSTRTCGRRRPTRPRARRSRLGACRGPRVRRALRLDRRRVQGRHRPASPPRQRAAHRPEPGRLHGLLAPGCRDEVLIRAYAAVKLRLRRVLAASLRRSVWWWRAMSSTSVRAYMAVLLRLNAAGG